MEDDAILEGSLEATPSAPYCITKKSRSSAVKLMKMASSLYDDKDDDRDDVTDEDLWHIFG